MLEMSPDGSSQHHRLEISTLGGETRHVITMIYPFPLLAFR